MNSLSNCRIMWNSLRSANSLRNLRNFSSNNILRDSKPAPKTSGSAGESSKSDVARTIGGFKHRVSNFDKWVLVLGKKYPSKDQVPTFVADDIMQSAMSKGRIRIANYMMVVVIILCIYTVTSSKRFQQEYVDQIEHTRDDYRKQITEEYRQSIATEGAKK